MSKGLEALEKGFWKLTHKGNIKFYNIVEEALKALEIIKKKGVDVGWLMETQTLIEYNYVIGTVSHKELTQEEYELLKEVLK